MLPSRRSRTMPWARNTARCFETVVRSEPTRSVSSPTEQGPRVRRSTIFRRDSLASAFRTWAWRRKRSSPSRSSRTRSSRTLTGCPLFSCPRSPRTRSSRPVTDRASRWGRSRDPTDMPQHVATWPRGQGPFVPAATSTTAANGSGTVSGCSGVEPCRSASSSSQVPPRARNGLDRPARFPRYPSGRDIVQRSTAFGLLLAVLSAAAFGTSGSLAKGLLAAGWSPGAAVTWRVAIGAIALAIPGIPAMRGRWHRLRRGWPSVVLFGLLAVAGAQLAFFLAIERLSVGVALLLEYCGVVLVVLWLWLRRGQRPRPLTVIGAVVAVVGLTLVLHG